MPKFIFNGNLYESKLPTKFIVSEDSFRLIQGGEIVSKCGYNLENSDEFFNEKYVTLNSLETNKRFRRMGYAKKLLSNIFEYVKCNMHIDIITLIVDKDNQAAMNLYFEVGFEIFMEYEDSLSMVKRL